MKCSIKIYELYFLQAGLSIATEYFFPKIHRDYSFIRICFFFRKMNKAIAMSIYKGALIMAF